jgi:hypothetical protein
MVNYRGSIGNGDKTLESILGNAAKVTKTFHSFQIGRIFAQWAIFYFGRFYRNYKSSTHFVLIFPWYW